MALNLNSITLSGWTCSPPRQKTVNLTKGRKAGYERTFLMFRLGVTKSRGRKKQPLFIDVEYWGKDVGTAVECLDTGSPVSLTGYLKMEEWVPKGTTDRQWRYVVVADTLCYLNTRASRWDIDRAKRTYNDEDPYAEQGKDVHAGGGGGPSSGDERHGVALDSDGPSVGRQEASGVEAGEVVPDPVERTPQVRGGG